MDPNVVLRIKEQCWQIVRVDVRPFGIFLSTVILLKCFGGSSSTLKKLFRLFVIPGGVVVAIIYAPKSDRVTVSARETPANHIHIPIGIVFFQLILIDGHLFRLAQVDLDSNFLQILLNNRRSSFTQLVSSRVVQIQFPFVSIWVCAESIVTHFISSFVQHFVRFVGIILISDSCIFVICPELDSYWRIDNRSVPLQQSLSWSFP